MLHLSAPMCLKKPEFAEFLFPFLVMNVICFPDDSTITLTTAPSSTASTMSLAAYVSYNLRCDASTQFMRLNTTIVYRSAYTHSLDHSCRTYILCDANTNTESIQLTLHTLNVLRKQFMAQGEEPEEPIVTSTKRGTCHSFLGPFPCSLSSELSRTSLMMDHRQLQSSSGEEGSQEQLPEVLAHGLLEGFQLPGHRTRGAEV